LKPVFSLTYPVRSTIVPASDTFSTEHIFSEIAHNIRHPLAILILQVILILAVSRTFAFIFTKIGQPPVMGEIIAGITLGPSLLGWVLPDVSAFVFPENTLGNLQFLSQIGLLFFMFIIGMELDLNIFKRKIQQSIFISHSGIALSFIIGILTGFSIYSLFAPPNTRPLEFALFLGMSMSITAFPVMARILQEKGYTKKTFGSMMIGIAAVDDVTAWCLLAVLIAYIKAGTIMGALPTVVLSLGYLGVMFFMIQPFLKKVGAIYVSRENLSRAIVGMIFGVMMISSYVTEVIGIHAFFGAFVAGVVMPPNLTFKKVLTEKIEDVSLVLLLPLFFVYTGLRTEIGLLNNPQLWKYAILLILLSIAGKFIGGFVSSKLTGHTWKESWMVGVLMNSRGLMELVVLNIGYDFGLFSKEIFTIMVLMALTTTLMAGPSLDLIEWIYRTRNRKKGITTEENYFRILISFGPPRMGATLMKIAASLLYHEKNKAVVKALHMTPHLEVTPQQAILFEKEGFQPIKKVASDQGIRLQTIYKITDQIDHEIIKKTQKEKYDLLLIGGARSLFTVNILGGKVGNIIANAECNVGIFIEKGMDYPRKILTMHALEPYDLTANISKIFASNPEISVDVLNVSSQNNEELVQLYGFSDTHILSNRNIDKSLLDRYDLMLINIETWKKLVDDRTSWLSHTPSVLILSPEKKPYLY
jgi:Kef-type K+ transport system membrane component KefB